MQFAAACQAGLDLFGTFPSACLQTLTQCSFIDLQQDGLQLWVACARLWQVTARTVDQHILPGGQPVVDLPGNAVSQAIGAPAQGKGTVCLKLVEFGR